MLLGTVTRLVVFACLLLVALASPGTKDTTHPRKFKKYDPAAELVVPGTAPEPESIPLGRSPRQTTNERRTYYPCISCFRVGSREICTAPFCPENLECDRSSKRCHKKANIRGRPDTAEPEEEAAPAK